MENLRFKCRGCQKYVRMNKKVCDAFSDWVYGCGQWSDFDENVPELSEQNWVRSELTPAVGENRTVFVQSPFDEEIGNEFWLLYEPALLYFNGWGDCTEEDICKCAIVRCRFQKVLISNEYSAWIRVTVQEVVFLHELYKYYEEVRENVPIGAFEEIPKETDFQNDRWHVTSFEEIPEETDFQSDRWHVTSWTAQGDCGEIKWIYTDENGIQHLVMKLWYAFDEEVFYVGNIRKF